MRQRDLRRSDFIFGAANNIAAIIMRVDDRSHTSGRGVRDHRLHIAKIRFIQRRAKGRLHALPAERNPAYLAALIGEMVYGRSRGGEIVHRVNAWKRVFIKLQTGKIYAQTKTVYQVAPCGHLSAFLSSLSLSFSKIFSMRSNLPTIKD